jgi:hypothetical protein
MYLSLGFEMISVKLSSDAFDDDTLNRNTKPRECLSACVRAHECDLAGASAAPASRPPRPNLNHATARGGAQRVALRKVLRNPLKQLVRDEKQ